MQLTYRLSLAIFATAVFSVGCLHAQEDDDDEEEFATMGFFGRSSQQLHCSLNLTQGPQVKFGNLGNLTDTLTNPAAGAIGRTYMDGTVNVDARRPYSPGDPKSEFSADGVVLSTSGGRYKYYDPQDKAIVRGDYLSYTPGYTRSWSYTNQSQAETNPGFIAMNIYSTRTRGESLLGSRGYTGGVELSVSKIFTAPERRISFSIVAGLSLTGINSSKSGVVDATLHTFTDLYSLNGQPAPVTPVADGATPPAQRYVGPSFVSNTDLQTETTVPISNLPSEEDEHDSVAPTQVKGTWKLKGAYFTLKVGPQVTAMITRNIGLSAGIGLAGSYAGTTYTANESFTVPGINDSVTGLPTPITNRLGEESGTKNMLLSGYYASIDATWALNERTGLFAGVSYDDLGDYSQSIGGRTAKIDLSRTAGVRGGLSIKF